MSQNLVTGAIYYPSKKLREEIQVLLKRDFGSASRGLLFLARAYKNKELLKDVISVAELKEREFYRNNPELKEDMENERNK